MERLRKNMAKLRAETARAKTTTATTTTTTVPQPTPRQTWGAEMEFLLYWRQLKAGECPDELAKRYPGVVLVPAEHRIEQRMFAARRVARRLRVANGLEAVWLEDNDGYFTRIAQDGERVLSGLIGHAAKHAHWIITEDPSVGLPANEGAALVDAAGLQVLGLEVVTPVFANCDAAFRELAQVLRSLAPFRTSTNVTTGLHVHVGYGRERLGTPPLRSIAAVLFASEMALQALDRPARRAYGYSPSTRAASNVALGMRADEAERREQGTQGRVERRMQRVRAVFRKGPASLAAATSEILRCQTTRGVARLMAAGRRPVFSFENYSASGVLNVPTIEFRQKEGTLDAHVITAWAQICLRLVEMGYEGAQGRAERAHTFIQCCQDYEALARARQPLGENVPCDLLKAVGKLDAAVACLRSGQAMPILSS